jgi:hypothetical protein
MRIDAGDLCRFGKLGKLAEALVWLDALPHAQKLIAVGNRAPTVIDLDEGRLTIVDAPVSRR